jgi:two-component system, OmpR family, alkaline phosphatase synthesis response regulator PhoP
MKDSRILIIDSDYGFASNLKEILEKNGFANVTLTLSAQKGLEYARNFHPAIVFLEVDLPVTDGIEVCTELRKISQMNQSFIVFISTQEDKYIQMTALNSGADDYLIKPVSERLFLSRVNAYLRRLQFVIRNGSKNASSLRMDFEKYLVIRNNEEVELPKKEFEILTLLFKNPRKVFSRQEIQDEIWGEEHVKSRTIDVHIKNLREKIGGHFIRTVKGVGYKLEYEK